MQNNIFNRLSSPLANKIVVGGEKYLYFGGTAYLGIPLQEDFQQLYLKGLKQFGLNNGTSRGNNVQLGIYDEVEQYAAEKFGAEATLITSSGYLAAQLTIKHCSAHGEVRYAPATHPALWQNEVSNMAADFKDWATNIVNEINASEQINWVIISNSMNNLYPEIYDFSFIKQLQKQVTLIVDDSHGIGINNNGLGAFSSIIQCENVEIVVVASMAKALGVDAGIVLASSKTIKRLKQTNEFLGASPPSAAGLYAFMQAKDIYEKALIKLNQNMVYFNEMLRENKEWHFIPNFPVYLSKNADLSTKLFNSNILISSFPYPDKDGPIINRVVLSSWHTKTDIEELIEALI